MEPDHETVKHLLDDHSLTLSDIAVMFGCRVDSLRDLLVALDDGSREVTEWPIS